ncbi:hypothetical protein MMC07_003782 [Pseudocyphellaria aurata]|nr:hypothetical protein [Pseudocyphellaria aurata]
MTTTNQANHQAMQSLEGESTEPRTLDRNVRHEMNLGLCEYPTAMMLTDVGEVSKEKRRDLKRSLELEERRKAKEAAKAVEGDKKPTQNPA